jgi:glyoxylase-like metal-dependent hydrolase (beta-lactamase superfamily II)
MRVHHLNCGTSRPLGGAWFDGASRGLNARLVRHCLLLESEAGLVLVDTGFGLNDVRAPHPRLSRTFGTFMNMELRERYTALRQVQALGFKARDVRHIVLTHLDFDCAGGIEDFPDAAVHVMETELHNARIQRRGFIANRRYRPLQLTHVRNWRRYRTHGERWFGFRAVRELQGLPPEILMVPLPGHSPGHAGIAVDTGKGWLLHAGDAYAHHGEMDRKGRVCPPGLEFYQRLMEVDRRARLETQAQLRKLALDRRANVRIICSQDAIEFEQCVSLSREAQLQRQLHRLEAAPMQLAWAEAS